MTDPIHFGTDGIRGIAGSYPLLPDTVLAIGRAIGAWLQRTHTDPTVVIGRDTRPSGSHLAATLVAGLTAEGIKVDDVGVITTPGVAHLTRALNHSMGIVISASHNPADQNGIKLNGADGFKLDDDDEAAIEQAIVAALTSRKSSYRFGAVRRADQYRMIYLQHLFREHAPAALQGLSVVLDCANGAAYELGPAAFAHLGATVSAIGASPTGDNINVHSGSEYVRRHRDVLVNAIRANDADLGIAFDGDADRVIFLTHTGTLIDGDHVLGLLATRLHGQGRLPGGTVVATTMSNSGLEHYLHQYGLKLARTKVGDRYVLARMREEGLALGGEQAGHIIVLDDDHTTGDGLHIALLVASLVTQDTDVLERLAVEAPKFPQVIASAHLDRRAPLEELEALQTLIDDTLVVFHGQGRVNVRYSGTEPNLLRVMVEGGPNTTEAEVVERTLALCRLVAEASQTANPHIDIVDCTTGAKIEIPRSS